MQTLTIIKRSKHGIEAVHAWPTGYQVLVFRNDEHLKAWAEGNL